MRSGSARGLLVVAIGLACAAVEGCTTVRDVTGSTNVYGEPIWQTGPGPGYTRDGVYALKRDLFYGKVIYPVPDDGEIFPPWAQPGAEPFGHHTVWDNEARRIVDVHPGSIQEYRDDPAKWAHIKGVVPKGTKLQVARVLLYRNVSAHRLYYIGRFVDGPFAGQSVLLNGIRTAQQYGEPLGYRSDCLEPADPPGRRESR